MDLKRKDTPENRAFWEFVEKTAEEWRRNRPSWAKKIEEERKKDQKEKE